jgi:hypothetical protein
VKTKAVIISALKSTRSFDFKDEKHIQFNINIILSSHQRKPLKIKTVQTILSTVMCAMELCYDVKSGPALLGTA